MEIIDAISKWLKNQVEQAGAEGVAVGLSGGLDSAVVAALAKRSLKDKVLGLILPCHSQKEDAEDANLIASHLQLETCTVDLSSTYDYLIAILPSADKNTTANIKPRLRMICLYYFASSKNYLVAGTGNKSEISVGYFTKYGDGGTDILPLGDLFKYQVIEIAKKLSLPEAIINKPPSAGLWPGQTDEGELKITYEQLDQAILDITSNHAKATPPDICSRVEELIKSSEHKRVPIPIFKNH
ncbi:MAG: NAD(+) synthase [Deltaproteobacteria bacterium]|jgi:NAD+ synthase|nr:NAD(+) synthase [Deltaproteobacteria bacterium]